MMCSTTIFTNVLILIASAVSLSNQLSAQVTPFNDDCATAIQLPVSPETSFNDFNLEGATRSTFAVVSTCGNDEHARDIWFSAVVPKTGKLHIEISAIKECPALTIYSGGCTNLSYLACDASKSSSTEKTILITEPDLIGKSILIRVHQENPNANNHFSIKTESREAPNVLVEAFEAKPKGQGVQLEWTTYGENEVYYTLLQHSINGSEFVNIQSIPGRNNNELENYSFQHIEPQVGKNIYRIVLVMQSGEEILFQETEINVDRYSSMIRVFPNPTTEIVYFEIPEWAEEAAAELRVMDMKGNIVQNMNLEITPTHLSELDLRQSTLTNGNYLLTLEQNGKLIMNTQLSYQR